MYTTDSKYTLSSYTLFFTVLISVVISFVFKWNYNVQEINFMGGDAKDYNSSLVSLFITHDFAYQSSNEWYLLKTNSGIINVHPVGVALLQLPFFLMGYFFAWISGAAVDGYSLPFQFSIAIAALFYATMGLYFLGRL